MLFLRLFDYEKKQIKKDTKMQLKTILNSLEKHPFFVYSADELIVDSKSGARRIEIKIKPRKRSKGLCSECKMPAPGYDKLPERIFQFIPLWGILVFFLYSPRRVNCLYHGVKVEYMPWAQGKGGLTTSFSWYLSNWAKHLSWQEVAARFRVSWYYVFEAVSAAVAWGREHMDLSGISAIGVDEVYWKKGKFMTVVYQIDKTMKRLLYATENREESSLQSFFDWFGKERTALLKYACSDMWRPYLKVIKLNIVNGINILDRYHVAAKMNKAIDKIRAIETKCIQSKGFLPVLKNSRWCLLKRPENLTGPQSAKLNDLMKCNLKTVRAYLLKEEFQFFWSYSSVAWAKKFFKSWCNKAMRSRLEPMKEIVKTLRRHEPLIMNWFNAKNEISLGAVEGQNNKLKSSIKKSYGFKDADMLKIALYHRLSKLPTPEFTHKYF